MTERLTIAINTGGGDCPGLNAVIRAVVKRGHGKLGWRVIGIEDSFDGLLGPKIRVRELTPDGISGALVRGGTLLGSTNRVNPFSYVDASGDILDRSHYIPERLEALGCKGLISLGGDGTMNLCHRLVQTHGIKVIGVPKTIDNDLLGTDITFGFNSAVEFATDAVDRLHTTAESHDRVMVVEVMGRNAGFIALHAGVAGGADAILIPEIPFDFNKVAAKIFERQSRGREFSIVVVAEGAHPMGGEKAFRSSSKGGRKNLGGISHLVAERLAEMTGMETRYTILGHLQRGGRPTAVDRILATRFGNHAVDLVARDEWNRMVVLHDNKLSSIPLAEAAGGTKAVDPNGDLVQAARNLGITLGAPDDVE